MFVHIFLQLVSFNHSNIMGYLQEDHGSTCVNLLPRWIVFLLFLVVPPWYLHMVCLGETAAFVNMNMCRIRTFAVPGIRVHFVLVYCVHHLSYIYIYIYIYIYSTYIYIWLSFINIPSRPNTSLLSQLLGQRWLKRKNRRRTAVGMSPW